jgi:hypothetical protein
MPVEHQGRKDGPMTHFTHLDLPATPARRFVVVLPEATYSELSQLAAQSRKSPAEVVQIALDLLKVAGDEAFRGHVLAIATREGELLQEIVIPS